MTKAEFIARIAAFAVADAKRSGVPASLTIAQAALESAWGASGLTVRAGNLFGIKGAGPAGSVTMPTTEYIAGKAVQVNAAFRAYHDWGESVADHSALLTRLSRYRGVLNTDGKTAARAVQAAGYATDPKYADKLIAIMDTCGLAQYDVTAGVKRKMNEKDAQTIIAKWLSPAWAIAKTKAEKDEVHRLADEIRKAAGIAV